jgi:hypothetical protein
MSIGNGESDVFHYFYTALSLRIENKEKSPAAYCLDKVSVLCSSDSAESLFDSFRDQIHT